jgi:hypothetical protein
MGVAVRVVHVLFGVERSERWRHDRVERILAISLAFPSKSLVYFISRAFVFYRKELSGSPQTETHRFFDAPSWFSSSNRMQVLGMENAR